jgi:hypothetical protein
MARYHAGIANPVMNVSGMGSIIAILGEQEEECLPLGQRASVAVARGRLEKRLDRLLEGPLLHGGNRAAAGEHAQEILGSFSPP